ncbi:MAG TPA: response regulator [Verrucomicrobiota bacterium]|nr:response regulator [Verrucomicrobiota bacterium]
MRKFDVKKDFGSLVRQRRIKLGISQEELAERANLHRTYVCDVERGARNVSLKSIERLAAALDVSLSGLFSQIEVQQAGSGAKAINGSSRKFVEILLVEDNPDDVEMELYAFKRARFANLVHVVRDGVEALDYLFRRGIHSNRPAGNDPQLVLLDLNLPKLGGIEVLRRMRAEKKTRAIPVVVLTVSQKDQDIAECQRLGVESYIVKPLDLQRLSEATPPLRLDWALLESVGAAR